MDSRRLAGTFSRYMSVGVLNTLLHWCVFFALHGGSGLSQAVSNLAAFLVAVTFSFLANASFTFKSHATWRRYGLFVGFIGGVSFAVGRLADVWQLYPLLTLVVFSAISMVAGFVYSNWVVFRERI